MRQKDQYSETTRRKLNNFIIIRWIVAFKSSSWVLFAICFVIFDLFSTAWAQDAKYRVNESVFVDENKNLSTIILRKQEIKHDIVIKEISTVINREVPQHVLKEETHTIFDVAELQIVKTIPQYVFDTKQTTVVVKEPQAKDPNILIFDTGTVAGNNLYANQLNCFKSKIAETWQTTLAKAEVKPKNGKNVPMDSRQIWLFRTAQEPYFENRWPISENAYPYESYFKRAPSTFKADIENAFSANLLKQLETWEKNLEIWVFTSADNVREFFKSDLLKLGKNKIDKIHLFIKYLGSPSQDFSAEYCVYKAYPEPVKVARVDGR